MKIALFGGAFDPPHIGHKVVADSLILNNIVDEVWFVPVFKHPWADRYGKHHLAEYKNRVAMLELSITAPNPTRQIAAAEQRAVSQKQQVAHYKDVSFTFNTLEFFSEQFPEHEFSWVMGSEYLGRFDDFLKGHPQLVEYQFYIYPRAGYPLDEKLKKENMIFLRDMPEVTASSTEIKQHFRNGNILKKLMLEPVLEFAIHSKLY